MDTETNLATADHAATEPAHPTAVSMDNVTFAYGPTPVLCDADVCIHQGEFVCIVGPNGGGKTTLVRLILGLLKPQQGSVQVFNMTPEKARHRIGYMPQYANLDPQFPISTRDVVLMGRLGNGWGPFRRTDRAWAEKALADVDLADRADAPFSRLSGGQQRRALIARALACKPDLLLLDEPTANLDIKVQEELYELLHKLSESMTILMVSHDVGFVSERVRRVICVNRDVHTHPTSELTVDSISRLFGYNVRVIRHDTDEAKHEH
ncbi:MAG: metal ABC transporter ATP-binding protein [Phycisphaerae bacterium]